MRLLGTISLLIAMSATSVFGAAFVHGPYTGAPSSDSVTVSWISEPPVAARVEYGVRSENGDDQAFTDSINVPPLEDNILVDTTHAVLSGLDPATRYAYRVVLIEELEEFSSPTGYFATEPNAGDSVSFAVLADTQQQLEGVNRLELVADAIAADPMDFDFILHAGDVVESPSMMYWDHWFASFDDMLLRAPMIPVLGNHEDNHDSYFDAFELPPGAGKDNERWWALHWADLVVVGLDTNANKANEIRQQQAWAQQHLSGSETHKFVIFHHPVFLSNSESGDTTYFYDALYHPIFVENRVDIVFNGHSHHYEHIVRDGVTYLVVGGGGAELRETTPEDIQDSHVSVEDRYFYARVTTSPDGIAVETVSVAREIGGTAVLTPDLLLDSFFLPTEPASETDQATGAEPFQAIISAAALALIAFLGFHS